MTTALIQTEAVRSGTNVAPRPVSDAIRAVVGALQRINAWQHRRRNEAQVRAMSDHLLRDIGIQRADIGFMTFGQARRR